MSRLEERRPRTLRRLLLGVVLLVALLTAVLLTNTLRFGSRQLRVPPAPKLAIDRDAVIGRLSGALRFRTVSTDDRAELDSSEFRGLHEYLVEQFPQVHRALARRIVGDHSTLYTWPGSDPEAGPIMLTGHLDVVPAEAGAGWSHPPFGGRIHDGYVWGRGALDDKIGVLGILEAVSVLLDEGFQPRRTIYLGFGHDEEVGGQRGAARIAELLGREGVQLEYLLDEGLPIVQGAVPGVSEPIAGIGIAQKGHLTVQLTVESAGGHSAVPPRRTAVGLLSRAIHRLEEHRMPARIDGPTRIFFEHIGPEMPFLQRMAFANLWLFEPWVKQVLAGAASTNALIRTTTAPTVLRAGFKENVLPGSARGTINFRVLPGDSVEGVLDHVYTTIDDPRVRVETLSAAEPSPVSSVASPAFRTLTRTIRETFPAALVAPVLVVGATDARHYEGIARDVYRFTPVQLTAADVDRMHGIDERVSIESYGTAVRFYARLIRNSGSAPSR